MRLPIRVRLTLLFAGLTTVVLVATGSFVFLRFKAGLDEEIDRGLRNQARSILEVIQANGQFPGDDRVVLAPTEPIAQHFLSTGALQESIGVLDSSPLIEPETVQTIEPGRFFETDVPTVQGVISARLLAVRAPGGSLVVIGSPLEARGSALTRLALLLLIGGPGALALTTWVAWRVAGGALRPVDDMRHEAATITATDPHLRLPVPPTGDEVARLGTTLNEMLDRLEEALTRERRFVDDASHELRTPLGNLRIELELALRRSRTKEELEVALKSAYEESGRVSRLAEDLLVLARFQHGRLPVRITAVDPVALVDSVVASFAARALTAKIAVSAEVTVAGEVYLDPERIRQALTNLIDNAIRHVSVGGSITISVVEAGGAIELSVLDSGPGFPDGFVTSAFEPFARPDDARSRNHGGTGLGLAIVKAVAESHGGTVSARNAKDGGAEVSLKVPSVMSPDG